MAVEISGNILKYVLQNVYFLTGTAYAGKSTMARLLAERFGGIHCGENYHDALHGAVDAQSQPNLSYIYTMKDWQQFIGRTPEEYDAWITGCSREAAQLEIVRLIQLASEGKRIFADTNIPPEILREISDDRHVLIMLSPQETSVERFFDREDSDKQFLLQKIREADDPEAALINFKACIAKVNSREHYDEYANCGFPTLLRDDSRTTEQTLKLIIDLFGLEP